MLTAIPPAAAAAVATAAATGEKPQGIKLPSSDKHSLVSVWEDHELKEGKSTLLFFCDCLLVCIYSWSASNCEIDRALFMVVLSVSLYEKLLVDMQWVVCGSTMS